MRPRSLIRYYLSFSGGLKTTIDSGNLCGFHHILPGDLRKYPQWEHEHWGGLNNQHDAAEEEGCL